MKPYVCPRCGKGRLYRGLISVVDECSECHLPLKEHEQGDGPAYFGILVIGALVSILAAIVEVKFEPPYWVHAALWIPFIFIGSIWALRFGKAMLIRMQYRFKHRDFQ